MNEQRARAWFALFVLAVFCAGAGAGFILHRVLVRPQKPGAFAGGPPPAGAPQPPPAEVLADQLTRELDLTPDQRTQLDAVLAARRGHIEEIQRKVKAMFDEEQQAMRTEVAKILTDAQRERFTRWLERMGSEEGRGAPPPGGRGRPGGPPPGPAGPGRGPRTP